MDVGFVTIFIGTYCWYLYAYGTDCVYGDIGKVFIRVRTIESYVVCVYV
jgi:hypothetical protein